MAIPEHERASATAVVAELEYLAAHIESLLTALGDKRTLLSVEADNVREGVRELKERLERGAKYGTVDGSKRPMTQVEYAFFEPAVRKTKAFLGINLNSRPGPEWFQKLYAASVDIGHPLADLKSEL